MWANSGMYFFAIARIDDLGFFVTLPTQTLSAAVTERHKFTLHGYVASGTDIIGIAIREHHYFFNWKFHAVFRKAHEKMPEE